MLINYIAPGMDAVEGHQSERVCVWVRWCVCMNLTSNNMLFDYNACSHVQLRVLCSALCLLVFDGVLTRLTHEINPGCDLYCLLLRFQSFLSTWHFPSWFSWNRSCLESQGDQLIIFIGVESISILKYQWPVPIDFLHAQVWTRKFSSWQSHRIES